MNIGELSELLGRDQNELLANLKLEEGTSEVPVESARSLIVELEKSKFSEGKTQGRDWGRKAALTEAEKKLSEKVGISGDFDTILSGIEEKIKATPPDSKTDIWKEKYNQLNTDFEGFKKNIDIKKKTSVVKTKLGEILKDYEGSEKIKGMIVDDFVKNSKFDIEDNEVLLLDDKNLPLKVDGKFTDFETHATTFVAGFLNPIDEEKRKPAAPDLKKDLAKKNSKKIVDADSALRAMKNAKTAEERDYAMKKLKEYED